MASVDSARVLRDVVRPYLIDPELRRLLPARPLLARECHVHVERSETLAIVGGRDTLIVEGREAVTELLPIVRAMDGTRTDVELAEDLLGGRRGKVVAAIALLFSCGLVEQAEDRLERDRVPDHLSGFLGSGVARTLAHPSRGAAWAQLSSSTVWIAGPTATASALGAALRPFVRVADKPDGCALGVYLSESDGTFDVAAIDAAVGRGLPVLLVGRSGTALSVGPLLTPQTGPTARCNAEFRVGLGVKHAEGGDKQEVDPIRDLAFGAMVAHHVVALLAGGVSRALVGIAVDFDAAGDTKARSVDVRHVRDENGGTVALSCRTWANPAWRRHTAVQDVPRRFRPIRGYEAHFTPAVIALSRAGRPLPAGRRYPFTPTEGGDVATICRNAAGINPDTSRPYAPSGGGLRSPSLFVHLHADLGGVPRGTWLYDEAGETLTAVGDADAAAFDEMGRPPGTPVATLAVVGNLGVLRRKYGPKCANLACFDAGIMLVHTALAIEAAGRPLVMLDDWAEGPVLRACGISADRDDAFVAGAFSVSSSLDGASEDDGEVPYGTSRLRLAPEEGPALFGIAPRDRIGAVLRRRRAHRDFPGNAILSLDAVARACAAGEEACSALGMPNDRLAVRFVAVTDGRVDCGSGVWRLEDGVATPVATGVAVDSHDLVIQSNVGDAPCVLMLCVDLSRAVSRGGAWGYRSAATSVGVAVAATWLKATELGLAGSPCGGFVGGELRPFGVDGHRLAAMLSFGIGPDADAAP